MKISFQGQLGSNSHNALLQYYPQATPVPCHDFIDALEAVNQNLATKALIPVENSLHGRVTDIHFLLPESGLYITAEHFLKIEHCLLANQDANLSQIKEVISHPQAMGQCKKWLRWKNFKATDFIDTAGAAKHLSETPQVLTKAVIAPKLSAELYNLKIIAENIADNKDNITRFVLLEKQPITPPSNNDIISSLIFELRNIPAALYKALSGFATNGVDLTKIESYQTDFEITKFYVEIAGHKGQKSFDNALEDLAHYSKSIKFLGSYPSSRIKL